jgi:hypothetical protein
MNPATVQDVLQSSLAALTCDIVIIRNTRNYKSSKLEAKKPIKCLKYWLHHNYDTCNKTNKYVSLGS